MPIDVQQFHQIFFEECVEGLEAMEAALLELQGGAEDKELLNQVFRAAHSIKGGSGTFGFSAISDFTHSAETLLDELRSGERMLSHDLVDLLLDAVDVLREMVDRTREGKAHNEERVNACRTRIDAALGNAIASGSADAKESVQESGTDTNASLAMPPVPGWRIDFLPKPHLLHTGNEPLRMFRELARLSRVQVRADVSRVPPFEDLRPEDCYIRWQLELQAGITRPEIDEIFDWVEGDCELQITPLEVAAKPTEKPVSKTIASTTIANQSAMEKQVSLADSKTEIQSKPQTDMPVAESVPAAASSSIRVGTDKVDEMINMVGELVITQSMLTQMAEEIATLAPELAARLQHGLEQLERNTCELQESVMRIRMLPISFAFNRFPRLVHDLCKKFSKKIELRLSGETTELDKSVLEKIGDPLVHLLRNSLDHGIESPQERLAAGKPETGIVELCAYHQGGDIVIEVHDDGRGLDRTRIREKAIERGLLDARKAISDEQLDNLIFEAGLSTTHVVSDVSGRGVGMDVVRRNIHSLGGSVEVLSREGQGTTFVVRLPLTMAIVDGQVVRVGKDAYILPLISILESLQIDPAMVKSVAGEIEVYRLRNEYIPIARLYEIFDIEADSQRLEDGIVVIVEGNGKKIGLFIDELQAQQQFVIKSLETNFRNVQGISGATILGDGKVALILDAAGLIRIAYQGLDKNCLKNLHHNEDAA